MMVTVPVVPEYRLLLVEYHNNETPTIQCSTVLYKANAHFLKLVTLDDNNSDAVPSCCIIPRK